MKKRKKNKVEKEDMSLMHQRCPVSLHIFLSSSSSAASSSDTSRDICNGAEHIHFRGNLMSCVHVNILTREHRADDSSHEEARQRNAVGPDQCMCFQTETL